MFFIAFIFLFHYACQQDSIAELKPSYGIGFQQVEKMNGHNPLRARPFKGTVRQTISQVEIECACEDDDLVFGSSGIGNVTHMGKVASSTTVCIEEFLFNEEGEIVGSVVNKVCTKLTAANGDEIILEGSPHTLPPGMLTVTFIGGTGRFEDVSGSADLVVSINNGIYTEVYDGLIYY